MMIINKFAAVALCALIACSLGCAKNSETATKGGTKANDGPLLTPPKQEATSATPKDDHVAQPVDANKSEKPADNKDAAKAESAKIKANLASLSPGDRALAEKQKICPVSGELLGSMDPPKKITVAGHEVFICCPGCEEDLKNDPAKYLAKIGLQPTK
ncbi:MAG TPA: hypothetical protein VHE81_07460 [Lacipirellulaceae bacterium]|nr:hypothetical protein [Lacipirellulaceae bacterium]